MIKLDLGELEFESKGCHIVEFNLGIGGCLPCHVPSSQALKNSFKYDKLTSFDKNINRNNIVLIDFGLATISSQTLTKLN